MGRPTEKQRERTRLKTDPELKENVRKIVDNRIFFDLEGAAHWLQVRTDAVLDSVQRGALTPAGTNRNGTGGYVFTHRDLERYRKRLGLDAEKRVVEMLNAGHHPIDAYLSEYKNGVKMDTVLRLTRDWAALTGTWVVQGPPGSYARWLERMGLVSVKPVFMRRIIEAILSDRHTNEVVRAKLETMALETSEPPSAEEKREHVSE